MGIAHLFLSHEMLMTPSTALFPPPYLIQQANNQWPDLFNATSFPSQLWLGDHLDGFNIDLSNRLFDHISQHVDQIEIWADLVFNEKVQKKYPKIKFRFGFKYAYEMIWSSFEQFTTHPDIDYKNFICSFNGGNHVSRQLLVSILEKFGFFNTAYCSKNFTTSNEVISGHLDQYVPDREIFYNKFFTPNSEEFMNTLYSFGPNRLQTLNRHATNINTLAPLLTQSFVHVVSETMATSYYPFATEKFLYSVVTRGLFVTYGQPEWHNYVEKYYGFKKYNKIFDYRFDSISNPVERLVELITMISKFSRLTPAEWTDLYHLEQDTIEYNYNHYFSGDYIKCLERLAK